MASCAPARYFGKKKRNTEAAETTRRWPAAPLLVVRYGLEPLIERAYNELFLQTPTLIKRKPT